MSSIEKTAYPRFPTRRKIKQEELNRYYSVSQPELSKIQKTAKTKKSQFNLALQLKSFQRLGYFVDLDDIPHEIIVHIRQSLKCHHRILPGYRDKMTKYRHRKKIREFLNINYWGWEEVDSKKVHTGMKLAIKNAYDIAHSMNNIADIINAVIEKLLQANYELPSFYRLNRIVRHTRHHVNNKIFLNVMHNLVERNHQSVLDGLLLQHGNVQRTLFNKLKHSPQRPGVKHFNEFIEHFHWLISLGNVLSCLEDVSKVKIDQFAEEARILTADEMLDLSVSKRYTLIASLIFKSQSKAKDTLLKCFVVCLLLRTNAQKINWKVNCVVVKMRPVISLNYFKALLTMAVQ
ncbi:MAG: hypothetical protein A3F46_05450 [Legionellales bacterium RIFCSPHIGHO2_12_FULL_42_9]|nr:MAG: hypothetical protein A3F46_05450 [Legionellales bacterium RIFCSPHIGHO2_12_FULL_42_9]